MPLLFDLLTKSEHLELKFEIIGRRTEVIYSEDIQQKKGSLYYNFASN